MRASQVEFEQNKLTVVTFNYDQSLEQYLNTTARALYGVDSDEAAKLVRAVPILHIHGHLGPLRWQDSSGRVYGDKMAYQTPVLLRRAAEGLRIVHEEVVDSQVLTDALAAIDSAKRIVFLGFGYLEENMRRIWKHKSSLEKLRQGTAMGMTNAERAEGKRLWGIDTDKMGHDCVDYLRNCRPLS
jgi:hypothetical protein